jgi:hypothetical protein
MTDDAWRSLGEQVIREDISDRLGVTRDLAFWSVIFSWANSDDLAEREQAVQLVVREFDRLEAENVQLRAELARPWWRRLVSEVHTLKLKSHRNSV